MDAEMESNPGDEPADPDQTVAEMEEEGSIEDANGTTTSFSSKWKLAKLPYRTEYRVSFPVIVKSAACRAKLSLDDDLMIEPEARFLSKARRMSVGTYRLTMKGQVWKSILGRNQAKSGLSCPRSN